VVSKEDIELESRDADDFFSYYNILNIVTDLTSFEKWLKDYHGLVDYNELLDGYVFFLNTCFRGLIDTIILENSFGIEEDYIFYRARFVGINIDDIPNTCEKTIFVKNIWEKTKKIRNSTSWDEITASIKDIVDLLKSFEKIYENYIVPVDGLPKNYALNSATILKTYIFLNDLQYGVPLAYKIAPILESDLTEKQVDRAYLGYVCTLQYLWYILLGEQKFRNSSLKNLHLAHEIYPLEESENFSRFSFNPRRRKKDCWASLDRFFGIIKSEIIEHLEDELKKNSNFNHLFDTLLVCQNFDKNLIEDDLVKYKLKDPEYLSREDKKSVYKKLDYYFMWYKADVLDGSKTSVFNGIPAFTSILIGNIEKKKYLANKEEIFVLRFKHRVGEKCYDYSYGILIEAFGSTGISDYSGWLIFLDCATDYSGFGGSLHYGAGTCIENYLDEGLMKIKEVTVDKNVFIDYLSNKSILRSFDDEIYSELSDTYEENTFFKDLTKGELTTTETSYESNKYIVQSIKTQEDRFMSDTKGKFFEYLFFNWLAETKMKTCDVISCDTILENEQIDIYLEDREFIHLFECKVAIHNPQKVIKQVKNKINALNNSEKKIVPWIIVYSSVSDERKKEINREGIKVCANFKRKIENWRKLNKNSKKIIFSILEFELEY
jgi:hypothetical protein